MKVYNAYRLEKSIDLFTLVAEIQREATELAASKIVEAECNLMAAILPSSDEYVAKLDSIKKNWDDRLTYRQADNLARFSMARDTMTTLYKKSHDSGMRSPFDFDACVTFRGYKGRVYMQVFADGPLRNIFDKWTKRPYAVDFHYQNQADKPESISESAWNKRREVWDVLYDTEIGRKTYLSLEVMNPKEYETLSILRGWKLNEEITAQVKAARND